MKITSVPLNFPNILSLYRLFSFPFVMIFVFIKREDLFVFFICFNLFTDFLDGWIARKFNLTTEIGSVLDSLADSGTYLLALAGILAFKWNSFQPYIVSFAIFIGFFILSDLLPVFKFGKYASYHIYSAKIGGYIKGIFFIVLFLIDFNLWFYYFMVVTGMLSFSENILITLILREPEANVRGLYWVWEKTKKEKLP
ncbi:MAG TPA: CDP-alcohol phosphatidyltransferase family protein [Prolixibacteraceae bacterium]|nr:CDP-alcohol phosphatidyltransferase family protein [Prolixibacteraceae bacterium]